jgi:hypothetical protein
MEDCSLINIHNDTREFQFLTMLNAGYRKPDYEDPRRQNGIHRTAGPLSP